MLTLGLEIPQAVLVLDDALARRVAEAVGLRFTGTLGLLLDAKRNGLLTGVSPAIEALTAAGFRLSRATRAAILGLAGEE